MTEKQIVSLIKSVAATLKKANGDHAKCEWGECYKHACTFAEEISVHSQLGKFPERLMRAKAPNETAEEIEYRKACFESITAPYWHRAESSLNRIWSEQNFTIKWPEEGDIKSYFREQFPVYGSVLSFFQSVVTKNKIRDPNAVLCIDFDLPVKENGEGEIVIDQSEQLEPYASIYRSCDVLMFELGDYALFMSKEKSKVVYAGSDAMKGMVMYLYDENTIYRIEQTGKFVDYSFTYKPYYQHNLGYLPAWRLKGIPFEEYADNPIYQSYFISAVPHLNKALKLDSTLDASIAKISFPIRAYLESKCNNPDCNDGKIYSDTDKPKVCGSCGGTGKLKFSPMRDFVQHMPGRLDTDQGDIPFPALTYVSPPTEVLNFNDGKIDRDIEKAFTFINIDVSLKSGTSQGRDVTAQEIKIDRDELFVFLLTISNELFSLLSNFMNAASTIRERKPVKIEVSPPKTFDLRTAAELTEELTGARTANIPAVAMVELHREYLLQRFTQQGNLAKIGDIVAIVDPYAHLTTQEVISIKGAGGMELWQFKLHNEIIGYIADELAKDQEFLTKDIKDIRTALETTAKANAAAMSKGADTNSILAEMANGGGVSLSRDWSRDDNIGKVPLALQQLALAKFRAEDSGDTKLAGELSKKMRELLKEI